MTYPLIDGLKSITSNASTNESGNADELFHRYLLIIVGILSIILGLLIALFGNRLFLYVRYFVGLALGFTLTSLILKLTDKEDSWMILIGVVVGLIVGVGCLVDWYFALSAMGALGGLLVSWLLLFGINNSYTFLAIMLLFSIIGAILAIFLSGSSSLIFPTSIVGALLAVNGVIKVVEAVINNNEEWNRVVGIVCVWALFASVVGALVAMPAQMWFDKNNKGEGMA